jgi:hypothetical protein
MSDTDDLREDLLDIQGIGPATADKILDTLADHDATGGESDLLRKARAAAEDKAYRTAGIYLRRAND